MSLSNLSSQLASLNSVGGGVTATAASSRKHEDAIGRGLYHSTKHGHTLVTNDPSSSVKFKPSVIHPDAKSAARADISLVTLRENAIQALQFIHQHMIQQSPFFDKTSPTSTNHGTNSKNKSKFQSTWNFLLGVHSLQYERGLRSKEENNALNMYLQQAFILLSTVLGEETKTTLLSSSPSSSKQAFNLTSAVLHTLEYLVQLYLPHVYNADSLIQAFLPHHESFIFQRLLQLIDLASLPQWSFLRPYSTGSNNTVVSRSVLATWVASTRDNGSGNGILFKEIGLLTQQVAQISAWEVNHQYVHESNTTTTTCGAKMLWNPKDHVRLGISFIISFTTALFVEAMTVQTQALGTLTEMTVRILLPFILDALGPSQDPFIMIQSSKRKKGKKEKKQQNGYKSLGSTCLDWRNFGYILAFALNENCELEIHVLEVLSTTAVYGCLENQSELLSLVLNTKSPQDKLQDEEEDEDDMEPVAALLIFLICMSKSMSKKFSFELTMKQCNCLPKLSKMKDPNNNTQETSGGGSSSEGVIGCYIPPSTFQALVRVKLLPAALSFLLVQKCINIKAFISSFTAQCISSPNNANEIYMKEGEGDTKLNLVLSMIREKRLEPLWMDATDSLSAAVSAYSAVYYSYGDENSKDLGKVSTFIKCILGDVQKLDPMGFDLGLSYSLSTSVIVKFSLGKEKIQALVESMGITFSTRETNYIKDNAYGIFDNLIPLGVALEHHDPEQRLEAMSRLISSNHVSENNVAEKDVEGMHDTRTVVLEELLRRFCEDKDLRVISKAAAFILDLVNDLFHLKLFLVNLSFLKQLYQGLFNLAITVRVYGKTRADNASPPTSMTSTKEAVDALLISIKMSASVVRYQLLQFRILDEDMIVVNDQLPRLEHLCLITQIICSHAHLPIAIVIGDENVTELIQVTATSALLTIVSRSTGCDIADETSLDYFFSSPLLNRLLKTELSEKLHSSTLAETKENVSLIRRVFVSTLVRMLSRPNTAILKESSYELFIGSVIKVLDMYDDKSVHSLESFGHTSSYAQILSSSVKVFIAKSRTSTLENMIAEISAFPNLRVYEMISAGVLETIYETLSIEAREGSFIVLMLEVIARPNTTSLSASRLLKLVKKFLSLSLAKSPDDRLGLVLIIHISYMMNHKDLQVRQSLFDLLLEGQRSIRTKRECNRTVELLFNIATSTNMRTQFLMDGVSSAQIYLRSVLRSAHEVNNTRESLIRACQFTVSASHDFALTSGYVLNPGASLACSSVIETLYSIGEADFPLSLIWNGAARPILNIFLQIDQNTPLLSHSKTLLDKVLVLLKGIIIRSESEAGCLVITTIPTGASYRSRSYSMTGSPDGLSFIHEYPGDMMKAICDCLSNKGPAHFYIGVRLCEIVLGSMSWANKILPTFDSSIKNEIFHGLLNLKAEYNCDKAGDTLLSLPLNIDDILSLLKSTTQRSAISSSDLAAVTFLAECVHVKSSIFAKNHELVSELFQFMDLISRPEKILQKFDGLDYTLSSILQALISILQVHSDGTIGHKTFLDLSQYNILLIGLIGMDSEGNIIPMISGRGKTLALKLLALICSADPRSVLSTLLPTYISRLKELRSQNGHLNIESDVLSAVIPAYYRNAPSAGLSFNDLICTVVQHSSTEGRISWYILGDILRGFLSVLFSHDESKNGEILASIISSLLAIRLFYHHDDDDESDSGDSLMAINELMTRCTDKCRLASFIFIFRYARELISYRPNVSISRSDSGKTILSFELYDLASRGPSCDRRSRGDDEVTIVVMVTLVGSLVDIVRKNMAIIDWKHLIKNDGLEADYGLKLWKEIVTLQSQSHGIRGVSSVMNSMGDCLSVLQSNLPIPHFLASVVSIVNDSKADISLRKKVIQMLAERSVEVDPKTSEGTLFVETITDLLDLLQCETTDGDVLTTTHGNVLLKQSVLACIEQMSISFQCRAHLDDNVLNRRLSVFTDVLQKIADLMNSTVVTMESTFNLQVLSSAALCASTLIGIVETRCLSFLPLLMTPLIASLRFANKWLVAGANNDDSDELYEGLQLLQVSILRVIQSVAENLPQSMGCYLDDLFGPSCLSSAALRLSSSGKNIDLVQETLTTVDNTLAKNIPQRLIIPSLTKAISVCIQSSQSGERPPWQEALSNIYLLKLVLSSSSRSTLVPLSGKIVHVLVEAYDFDDTEDNRNSLLSSTNEAMLGLVMKLSEVQLRSLYLKLREWKGDFDSNFERRSCLRRQAFWKLSAILSIELRSIFLPCIGTVLIDAIAELDAVSLTLCTPQRLLREEKRRKISSEAKDDLLRFSSVQPLLLALESSLKADAQESLGWIAADDGRMYHSLLKPLGKLFTANIPETFPVQTDLSVVDAAHTSKFSSFVGGTGTELYGSVTGCLTAMALAGGDEVLWKPLNHVILEACSDEKRYEVRKAGVGCLLSIIKALGEEYMVLLPECLPVLSELLEDQNVEIVNMAKECIRRGEELLGESLDDNIR